MESKLDQIDNFSRISRYSLLMSVVGLLSCITAFPSGIYYGFVCSAIGIAGGCVSHRYSKRKLSAVFAIIFGIINVMICVAAYQGLHSMYTMLQDPVDGPKITEFILGMLEQYGVPVETFVQLMKP